MKRSRRHEKRTKDEEETWSFTRQESLEGRRCISLSLSLSLSFSLSLSLFAMLLPHAVNCLSRKARNIHEMFDKIARGLINGRDRPRIQLLLSVPASYVLGSLVLQHYPVSSSSRMQCTDEHRARTARIVVVRQLSTSRVDQRKFSRHFSSFFF